MKDNYRNNIRKLEEFLAEKFSFSNCILTGRATSGFSSIFKTLFKENDHVIFPAILCPQPIMSAKSANLIPVIADVDKQNGMIEVSKVEKLLIKNKKIKAIVFVELFGQQYEVVLKKLSILTTKYKIILIRDCAQSLPINKSEADLTIISFGHTKILDSGHGGAVLTNNKIYADQIRKKIKSFEQFNEETFNENTISYRKNFYSIKSKKLSYQQERILINQLLQKQTDFYNFKFCEKYLDIIFNKISKYKQTIDRRRYLSSLYFEKLYNKNLHIITKPNIDIPWRFSILLPNNSSQKVITSKLRTQNFHASNWYESVVKYFIPDDLILYEEPVNSYHFEQRILNLWIDDNTSIKYIKDCADYLENLSELES